MFVSALVNLYARATSRPGFASTGNTSVAPVEHNYRDQAELVAMGDDGTGGCHGLSAFPRGEADVFHTDSTYAWARRDRVLAGSSDSSLAAKFHLAANSRGV